VSESAELEPWQQRALDSITQYKGRGLVQITGRGVGKSTLNTQMAAYKRMFDDVMGRPVEDLVLSEGTVYGSRYYCVEPVGGSWLEMETWALDTYGSTGSIWQETKNLTPEPLQRWYMNNRKFWFKELKDRDWFVLRWHS
jgi:hypothetical protein